MRRHPRRNEIEHGMLLDGKSVMDDALPLLEELREYVAEVNHADFDKILTDFENDLAGCDVRDQYQPAESEVMAELVAEVARLRDALETYAQLPENSLAPASGALARMALRSRT